ncbi:MAG: GNAT family N-acetyltransferase [Saccharofermentans sp.]|nr:GNAT family N-acetyltransferase [Saccharofermentans sp.]
MDFNFRKATIEDIDILVSTRVEVLRAANKLNQDTPMSKVELETRNYYESAFLNGDITSILVFDGDKFIGSGAVSYYRIMPTYHNPSGIKAYIVNMYTNPDYRRQGIAYKTLDMLIEDCKSKGVTSISLEATEMGRPLYEKYGFIKMNDEMEFIWEI